MEILKNNNWCKINEAFQLFVNTGRIMPNTLRPEVEQSWRRCQNIDFWTPRPRPISREESSRLMKANAELLQFARPVLEYVYATNTPDFDDNIAQLTEKPGWSSISVHGYVHCPTPLTNELPKKTSAQALQP